MRQDVANQEKGPNRARFWVAAGIVAAAVAVFVLYAIKPPYGKDAAPDPACPEGAAKAERLAPLI